MSPTRTCLGCRRRADKVALLRLVADGGRLVADEHQTRPGRGGYLHRRAECFQQAVKRRAFGRALRQPGLALDGFDFAAHLGELERSR